MRTKKNGGRTSITIYLLTPLLLLICLLLYFDRSRRYYYNNEMTKCVTIWKRIGGSCYVIPIHYDKLTTPKDQAFIVTSNLNTMTFVWDNNSKYDLIILNDKGLKTEVHPMSSKIKYYALGETQTFNKIYRQSGHFEKELQWVEIDIGEMIAFVNGKRVE